MGRIWVQDFIQEGSVENGSVEYKRDYTQEGKTCSIYLD